MKKSFVQAVTLIALVFALLVPSLVKASPNYIVVGYAPGYNSNASYNFTGNFASAIPWTSLSHVYYAFVTISGTTAVVSDGAGVAAAICTQAHSHGVRCYLSVGGANPSTQWNSITSTGNAQTLANSITGLIHYGGVTFDGIDVDWEFPTSATVYNALLQQIQSNLSSIIPGMLPSGKYAGESREGLSVYLSPGSSVCGYAFTTSNSYVDWYTDSGYDLNVGVSGDSWNGALSDPNNKQFTNCLSNSMQLSISTIANWYNTVGNGGTIPYNKMVLGMPLYGRNSGGTATTPDAVAFGGSGSGYNTTAAEEVWGGYSMDTAQSFCDKMNWAIGAKGMKGIAMWDLGQGLPTTANSMMTSIWNVINGSASCLTVGGGPGSPTATPTSTPSCGTLVADFESGSAQDNLGGFSSLSAGACTMNPTTWAPSAGYGLNGTTYGARVYGTTTGCTWGPSVLIPLGAGTPSYNASSKGQNAETFRLKITTGPASGPATLIVGVVPTNGTTSGFQYNLVIPAGSFNTDLTETVFFSQMAYSYGAVTTLDTTQLYQLYFTPYPGWGNYDITIDQIVFTCAPTPTPTPTNTNTATFTKTNTPTNTITNTPVPPTNTFTLTKTNTPVPPTNTFTNTPVPPTNTFTFTKTNTPTNTYTNTPVPPTNTFTFTKTNTPVPPTNTFTNTPVPPTNTFTFTKTNTPTNTYTNTPVPPTNSFTPTKTNTPTNTFTNTPVPPTNTMTNTPMAPTNSFTPTSTKTNSFTNTPLPPTNTPTNTLTLTNTNTPAPPTNTFTSTNTRTNTFTFTITNTPVPPTNTFTPTNTNTLAPPTNTFTATNTRTNTYTFTITNTPVPPTSTFTSTNTNTPVPPTATFTFTNTRTFTNTSTPVPPTSTFTNTSTKTDTPTNTNSFTPTNTNSFTSTKTFTNTPTITDTPTNTGTPTNTYTGTVPPTNSPTNSFSPTNTSTNTWTSTSTSTSTYTPANTSTNTWTATSTFTSTSTNSFTNSFTPTNTSTPTNSYTPTNSFTGTLSPTSTSTNTPTNTWTGTPTNTATFTSTNSFTNSPTITNTPTSTSTFTNTFTATATFTATQPVVQLGNGPNPPSNTTVPAGSTNQVVMQVSVDNTSGESLQLSDLLLTFTGTGDAASGIVSVTLWKDPSGNGTTSGSSVLATVNSPFASGTTASVVFNDTVGAGATQNYLITYNFASGAAAGTYSVSLANGAALTGQGTVSLQSLQVQGAPVNGALLTVVALTATPSFTSTVTSSFTPVPPTVTPTETPIVRVTLSDPYPNPVSGAGELSINVTAPGDSSLIFAVFTTSFRKVWDDTLPIPQGPSVVRWNLRNKEGVPVADGLYYIRLQVIGLHTTTKVFKVLVLQ